MPIPRARLMKNSRFRRWRKLVLLTLLVITVAITASAVGLVSCASAWLPAAIVHAPNQGRAITHDADASPEAMSQAGAQHHLRVAVGPPDAELSVWVIDPPDGRTPRGTVFVLHGLNSDKRDMIGSARMFANHHYRAVLVDLRGHGQSTGDYVTFGVRDGPDLSRVIDALANRNLIAGRIAVYGPSFGGAAALHLAAADDRIDALILIATFTRLRDVVPIYVRTYLPGVGHMVSDTDIEQSIVAAGQRAGFDPDAADSVKAIARVSCPVLILHGRRDEHIPYSHAQALESACTSECRLVPLEDATHYSIMDDNKQILVRETMAWLARFIDQ